MAGFVYLGYDRHGLFKIGMTENFKKRLKQIQNMNPNFMYFCVIDAENPAVAEMSLHTTFRKQRCIGEWFELSAQDIMWILENYLPKHITRPPYEDVYRLWQDAVGEKEL